MRDSESPDHDSGDGETRTRAVRHTGDSAEQSTLAVVEAVAAATDRDPLTMPPLHDAIDTDALDALVDRASEAESALRVTFAYAGATITVEGGHSVTVEVLPGAGE